MKNVYVVKQLLLDGTRSVLYHLIYEKMSEIIAKQPKSCQKSEKNSLGRLPCVKYQLSVTIKISLFPAHF